MRTAVITGGNGGLGFHCAEVIARDPNWRVVLACRDLHRGREAAAEIAHRTGHSLVDAVALDLASLESVRRCVRAFEGEIDALVLNAGVQIVTGRTTTEDGFETTFAVNHLGHFLLANLLLPRMARGSRIIFVSSDTHDPQNWTGMPAPRFTDPVALSRGEDSSDEAPGLAGRRRYTTSKLCNVYCAYEMHRRIRRVFPDRDISVNAFDPGLMPATGLARDYGPVMRFLAAFVLPITILFWPNANRVGTSARRLARVAIDPAFSGISGQYFSRGKQMRSSVESYDEQKARELWEASVNLTKLTEAEAMLAGERSRPNT